MLRCTKQHWTCCLHSLVLVLFWPLKVFSDGKDFHGVGSGARVPFPQSTCTCTGMWLRRCQRRADGCFRLAAMRLSVSLACHLGPLSLGVAGFVGAWQGFGTGNRFRRQAQGRQEPAIMLRPASVVGAHLYDAFVNSTFTACGMMRQMQVHSTWFHMPARKHLHSNQSAPDEPLTSMPTSADTIDKTSRAVPKTHNVHRPAHARQSSNTPAVRPAQSQTQCAACYSP